jgi:hypothetical protein
MRNIWPLEGPGDLVWPALAFHFIKNEGESEGSVVRSVRRKERFGWVLLCWGPGRPAVHGMERGDVEAPAAAARGGGRLGDGVPCEVCDGVWCGVTLIRCCGARACFVCYQKYIKDLESKR